MSNRLKVLLTTNIPSPYFVNYADEFGKYVDLTVVFELTGATDRDDKWQQSLVNKRFKYFFLNAKRTNAESGLSFKIKKFLKDRIYNRIIIANPTTPTGIVALLYCRRHKIPFIIQSEGGFQGSGKGIKERLKKYLMEKAEMYLTGMGGEDDYFLKYGATPDRLKPYHFTSSYEKDIDDRLLTIEEKKLIKNELEIDTKYMVLYVGQFIHRKGLDILLKAFKGFDQDSSLFLVGGEMNDEYLKIISDLNLKNVRTVNFVSKNDLRKYYQAADIFVVLTREDTWGLVINEAMEHGLPIVSTKNCIAARCLVDNGVNGYLVDSEDIESAHNKIKYLLNNEQKRHEIAEANLDKIKSHTIENMALSIFNYIR